MKKAVISSGNKQYLVSEGDIIEVELLNLPENDKKVEFDALLIIDGDNFNIGSPDTSIKVTAEVIEHSKQTDKVTSIRYKAKKRVRAVKGHRQIKTVLKISKIS